MRWRATKAYCIVCKCCIPTASPPLLQNPVTRVEAEQALLQFRANASLWAVQYVLQHCTDDIVRFQALLALRDMLLGRWPALELEARRGAVNFLLHLATVQLAGADAQPLLRSTAVGAAAVAIKRGWDDASPAEREATLRGIHEHAGRRASLELLAAVVLEFTPATASSLGLPWCARFTGAAAAATAAAGCLLVANAPHTANGSQGGARALPRVAGGYLPARPAAACAGLRARGRACGGVRRHHRRRAVPGGAAPAQRHTVLELQQG